MTVMGGQGHRRRAGSPEGPAPRWTGQLAYVLVLCGVAAGLVVVVSDHFKRGSLLIAGTVFVAAVVRLTLPESRVGMLAIRSRALDVLIMLALALGIAVVAVGVPPLK